MKLFSLLSLILGCVSANAGDLEWSGGYRVEGVKVNKPEMNGSERNKQYILHHLVLSPKINAYDGVTIYSRFDVMNSVAYPNSQVGQFFGNGVNNDNTTPTGTPGATNTLSENQSADFIAVNQLYLTYAHEFGLLTVGRAPLHFGLGMSYNGGFGAFDHWFDNRDMVAYKFVTGNLSFMPAVAKLSEKDPGFSDDVDDYMMQVQYENPETDLKIGLLYRNRHAGRHGNDTPGNPIFGDASSVPAAGVSPFKGQYWNFFISRFVTESFRFGIEGGVQKGQTGVQAGGSGVTMNGFGAALELDYIPKASNFHAFLRAGIASGDDPSTPGEYEGFIFDRNYDVAFLLFNHPMGNFDVFRNGAIRDTTTNTASRLIDEDAISNVMYFAPSFKYKWTERFDSTFGLTYAQLDSDPLNVGVDKAVGYEVDVTLNYKPHDGVQWVNRIGVFAPGDAYKGGTNGYSTNTVIGLETKAAITF